MLKYKNLIGKAEYDSDGKIFIGEVLGLRDVITFQGRSPEELEESFRKSVDYYLEMLDRDNDAPAARRSLKQHPAFGSWKNCKIDAIGDQRDLRAEWDRQWSKNASRHG